jgi:hypothetical protein
MKRAYTGTTDGIALGHRAGMNQMIKEIERISEKALWNNGSFGVRNARGKESLSVHATGRAVDISFRVMKDGRGKPNGRKYVNGLMNWLTKNADAVGLEMIIHYAFGKYGRAWRCDRMDWKAYEKETVHGGGSLASDWIHIEITPKAADDPEFIKKAFSTLTKEILLAE